jgi:hypothetical protein
MIMKKIIIAAAALALSSSMAMADQPAENENNGAGGQALKEVNELIKENPELFDTKGLGQPLKSGDLTGGPSLGSLVSEINQETNHDE